MRGRRVGVMVAVVVALLAGLSVEAGAPPKGPKVAPLKEVAKLPGGLEALVVQAGHHRAVHSMSFSRTGQVLATASGLDDGMVKLWDVGTGKLLRTIDGEDHAAMSPDGALVVTGEVDGPVKVWEVRTGKLLHTLDGGGPVAFSPDGKLLVGEAITPKDGKEDLTGAVQLWDVETWKPAGVLKGHKASLTSLSFSKDGEFLASASFDGDIKVWDMARGRKLARTFGAPKLVPAHVALSPDAETLVATYQRAKVAHLWDVSASKIERTLDGHGGRPLSADIAADNATVVTAALDGKTRLWSMKTGALLKTLDGGGVARFTPSGKSLAHGKQGVSLVSMSEDLKEFKEISALPASESLHFHMAFSKDGKRLVTTDATSRVDVWEVKGGKLASSFTVENTRMIDGKPYPAGELVLSGDGRLAALRKLDKPDMQVWTTADGKPALELKTGGEVLRSVAFSPDDAQVVWEGHREGDGDATRVTWWDVKGARALNTTKLVGHTALAGFSQDGKRVAVVSYGSPNTPKLTVKLWDRQTGLMRSVSVKGIPPFAGDVSVAPTGPLMAFGDQDGSVKLWDRDQKKIVQAFKGHKQLVNIVRLSPSGRLLATGSWDESVRLWDTTNPLPLLTLDDLVYKAQEITFSPDEQLLAISQKGWVRLIHLPTGRWRTLYRRGDGWMIHDDAGRFECAGDGCALVHYRDSAGALVPATDARAAKLKGLQVW